MGEGPVLISLFLILLHIPLVSVPFAIYYYVLLGIYYYVRFRCSPFVALFLFILFLSASPVYK